jgi:hypothetical protein
VLAYEEGVRKRKHTNCVAPSHSTLNDLDKHKRAIAAKCFTLYRHLLYTVNFFPSGPECKQWKLAIIRDVVKNERLNQEGML